MLDGALEFAEFFVGWVGCVCVENDDEIGVAEKSFNRTSLEDGSFIARQTAGEDERVKARTERRGTDGNSCGADGCANFA